jgi:hypothetical protein
MGSILNILPFAVYATAKIISPLGPITRHAYILHLSGANWWLDGTQQDDIVWM